MFLFCRQTDFSLSFLPQSSSHPTATYRELSPFTSLLLFLHLSVYQPFNTFIFYQFFILTLFFTFLSPNYFNLGLNYPINQPLTDHSTTSTPLPYSLVFSKTTSFFVALPFFFPFPYPPTLFLIFPLYDSLHHE
jgi:hypothetical protein